MCGSSCHACRAQSAGNSLSCARERQTRCLSSNSYAQLCAGRKNKERPVIKELKHLEDNLAIVRQQVLVLCLQSVYLYLYPCQAVHCANSITHGVAQDDQVP